MNSWIWQTSGCSFVRRCPGIDLGQHASLEAYSKRKDSSHVKLKAHGVQIGAGVALVLPESFFGMGLAWVLKARGAQFAS